MVSTGYISIGNDHEDGHEDKTADRKKNMCANIIGAVLLYLKKSHLRSSKRYQKRQIVYINPCHIVPLFCENEIWVTNMNTVQSNKTILFDILDFWCQLEVIRFVKSLSKRRMFVSFLKISACWLLHRLIKFNKICWEKRPAHPRPNMRTSFCRGDLKNTQPHLKPILVTWFTFCFDLHPKTLFEIWLNA